MKILELKKKCKHGTHKLLLSNNKEFFASISYRGLLHCEELSIADVVDYDPIDIPINFSMFFVDFDKVGIESFFLFGMDKEGEDLSIIFSFDRNHYLESRHLKWAPLKYMKAINKEARDFETISIPYYRDVGDECQVGLEIKIKTPYRKSIKSCIKYAKQQLRKLIYQTSIQLGAFAWNPHFEKDERYFSTELLIPLFRKMGFEGISYNHGRDEFGKDITLQELDKFGIIRRYGVQVKAGNISGKSNSTIDTLISQIDDAFRMPYIDLNSHGKQYISMLTVICSGHFTHNAKEKIKRKLSQGLHGSVNFLDKNKIHELVRKYWHKTNR